LAEKKFIMMANTTMTSEERAQPVPHTLFAQGTTKGIKVSGWTVTIKKAPIFNSTELDKYVEL
jgi:hypothetical protein